MIKAIIVDFGNVIYKTKWGNLNKFFFDKNGFNILVGNSKDEELIRIYNDSDVGKEDFKKFFFRINPNISNINRIVKDYKEGYTKFKVVNTELVNLLKDLKNKGIRLFGFTDIKKEHYDSNVESGMYDDFEKVFTSFEFGCLKSDKKAFDMLTNELKNLHLNPSECLFIDDNLENIGRAKEKNFQTIHYPDFPDINNLKEELSKTFNLKI
jgi:putative hydrolase of the HAD superfamily